MSESAWGKISFDNKLKAWKMSCRNWECGVLLPVPAEAIVMSREAEKKEVIEEEHVDREDSETESEDEAEVTNGAKESDQLVGMEVFDHVAKPPFEIPGRKYDGTQPWYFTEPR
jgi:hypothetical protein